LVFRLENILPNPLAETDTSASQIWKQPVLLEPGKCIRLKAASGRGKSTLIHILYGRRKDYTGKAFLNHLNLSELDSGKWAELRQKHLAIVFQELMLFPDLTAWENIILKNKLTRHYSKERILEFAERVNVQHLLQKKCGIMSFGERQRIAIVRALVQPFNWLLLDEPFSHLDDDNSTRAAQLMADECKAQGAGILITALGDDNFFHYDKTLLV
jgi:putative ABC transport system ATP-binding protein